MLAKMKKLIIPGIISLLTFGADFANADQPTNTSITISNVIPRGGDNNTWVEQLNDDLKNGRYQDASAIINKQDPSALIGVLQSWAYKNNTVAQWFYAESLYKANRMEESASWTFTAFFFTRFDESLCSNPDALNLEKMITDNYHIIVSHARTLDTDTMNLAVLDSTNYLKSVQISSLDDRDPSWICDMVSSKGYSSPIISEDDWDKIYKERLSQFIAVTDGEQTENQTISQQQSEQSIGQ